MAQTGMKNVAEDEIRGLLRMRRRVPAKSPDSFGISSAEQIGEQFRQIMSGIFTLVVGVVSVGLLVGGVGVMNIMLMSVTERTREIGVRKAIGARRRDISFQFLTEAMTLTGAGGILGVDRKSTRLNSSHVRISYAVFCLKKKKTQPYLRRSYYFV